MAGWLEALVAGRLEALVTGLLEAVVAGLVEAFFALGAADLAFACGAEAVASALPGRAARLSLRRCGRRCGSAERTSDEDEFWSVIARFRRC